MRICDIIRGTTVDGPGFRTSIYMSGCYHRCEGCHNPATWDYESGQEMTLDEIMQIVAEEDFDVTLSGGDPLFHPVDAAAIARAVVESGHKVWLYTGFTWEQIMHTPLLQAPLPWVETVVDGPFITKLRDETLLFRGSSNQRLIDVKATLRNNGKIIEWERRL